MMSSHHSFCCAVAVWLVWVLLLWVILHVPLLLACMSAFCFAWVTMTIMEQPTPLKETEECISDHDIP